VLLGVNEGGCAEILKLRHELWSKSPDYEAANKDKFIQWCKRHTMAGTPVISAVYLNCGEEEDGVDSGMDEYDHIVTLVECNEQVWAIADNGSWPTECESDLSKDEATTYTYPTATVFKTRQQANFLGKGKSAMSMPCYPDKVKAKKLKSDQYGVAVLGIVDEDKQCVHVQLTVSHIYEPEMKHKSIDRPPAMKQALKVHVWGLTPGIAYNLYQYNDILKVPTKSFNASKGVAFKTYPITLAAGAKLPVVVDVPILSCDQAIFRCVPATVRVRDVCGCGCVCNTCWGR
jgi:hypothetical protein